ncbi:MAG TPA: tetratricopeptide repeat protein [Actinomycetota bacterium]|nr:tetratricopeptide repeat protein [Actinomycetota bacterium]
MAAPRLRSEPLEGGARASGPLPTRRAPGSRFRTAAVLAVTLLAGLLVGRFVVAGGGGAAPAPTPAGADAVATVARLQAEARQRPDEPRLLTQLGVAYLTRARETADPSFYTKAAGVLERASELAPRDAATMTARGLLDLGRHDFRAAFAWGTRALRANPDATEAYGIVFDAQVELGRYDAAVATAQAMVDRKPTQGSLARASYARELLGDTTGALTAMTQAAAAGGGTAGERAYVQTLIGNLHLGAGRLPQAEAAYRRALDGLPAYASLAEVGLAQVAAARGDLAGAAELLEPAATRLPLPATVALLGDLRAAQGDIDAAAGQYRLVRVIERLNQANGVAVDLELARFEADQRQLDEGADPARAVAMARRAMAERPTILAADALGWALRQAGRAREALPHARAAVRLGTRDALLWYHLAVTEADLGMTTAARRDLASAFRINPYLTVRDRPAALALAGRLHVPAPSQVQVGGR